MRRAILTLGGTAVGLAALFSFKTHSLAGVAALGTPANPTAAPMGGNGSMMTTAPSGMGKTKSKSKKTGMSSGSGMSSPSAMSSGSGMSSGTAKQTSASTMTKRTLTGAVENTPYGPMQVQVTMTGSKITEVTVLQHTNDGGESAQ